MSKSNTELKIKLIIFKQDFSSRKPKAQIEPTNHSDPSKERKTKYHGDKRIKYIKTSKKNKEKAIQCK